MSAPAESTPIVVVKRPRGGLFAALRGVPVWLRAFARAETTVAGGPVSAEPTADESTVKSAHEAIEGIGAASSRERAPHAEPTGDRQTRGSPEPAGLRSGLTERGAVIVESASPALVVELPATSAGGLLRWLRDEPDLAFDVLHDLTVVDRLPDEPRFEVVYFLRSSAASTSLRVRARIEAEPPEIDSVAALWRSADWLEREARDLFGVRFVGHPGMQPLLLPSDFEGAPLRRDFGGASAATAAVGEGDPP